MDLILQPLRKYADFKGRARRAEYWLFYLLFMIVYVTLILASGGFEENATPSDAGVVVSLVAALALVAMLIPLLAVHVRRLHDVDRSAWWLFISFVPLVGALVLFVFTVLDSTPGRNRFGPNPKTSEKEDVSVFS